eukprot:6198461-Pleurochrysis_carterae.AAC.6
MQRRRRSSQTMPVRRCARNRHTLTNILCESFLVVLKSSYEIRAGMTAIGFRRLAAAHCPSQDAHDDPPPHETTIASALWTHLRSGGEAQDC